MFMINTISNTAILICSFFLAGLERCSHPDIFLPVYRVGWACCFVFIQQVPQQLLRRCHSSLCDQLCHQCVCWLCNILHLGTYGIYISEACPGGGGLRQADGHTVGIGTCIGQGMTITSFSPLLSRVCSGLCSLPRGSHPVTSFSSVVLLVFLHACAFGP